MKKIWKRLFVCALAFVLAFPVVGCGDSGEQSSQKQEEEKKQTVSLLTDKNFENGFSVHGLDSVTDSGIVKTIDYGTGSTPNWGMAQWWSKYNLKDGEENITQDAYSLKDGSKTIEVNRKHGSLTLGIDGSKEFDSYNAVAPSRWPHLLIEQSVPSTFLSDAAKLEASLDFTLTVNEDKRESNGLGFQAQFAWFIYIVDKNPESPGYGNFLWFGLSIFMPPNEVATSYSSQDTAGGLGNYIYSLSADTFMNEMPAAGKTTEISFDIMPYVSEALAAAQEKGFMPGTTLADVAVTGTNIGWEVFDRWNVSITLNEIGLYVK